MEKVPSIRDRIYRWFSFVERSVADRRGLAFVEFGCVLRITLSILGLLGYTPFLSLG